MRPGSVMSIAVALAAGFMPARKNIVPPLFGGVRPHSMRDSGEAASRRIAKAEAKRQRKAASRGSQ